MRSIRTRLIGGYVLVVTVTLMIALTVGRWLLDRDIVRGIDLLNTAEYQEIHDRVATSVQAGSEAAFLKQVENHAELDDSLYFFQVRKIGGAILFRSPNMKNAVFTPPPLGKPHRTDLVKHLGTVRISHFREGPYEIQIGASLGNRNQLFSAYSQVALTLLGIALALSLFFGYLLSRLALDPIRRIQQTASRITADNLSERIPETKAEDEVADLARLMNQMFDRLEYSFGRLWRFAADASHELKTPLSLIRLQSEKLLLHGNLAPSQQDAVQQQMESIDRLHSVIEKLLFISKSEFGAIRLNLRMQNVHDLVKAFAEDAQVLCEDAGVRFAVLENEEIPASVDAALLRQVLLNLLNNALNVLDSGGVIRLSSSRQQGRWIVTVEDTGPGIPEERLHEVFEPFFRLQRDGNCRNGAGAGLGLAICRSILDLHHGKIHAENREDATGLRVTLELPL